MEGRDFPTPTLAALALAGLAFAACRIDSVGLAPSDDDTVASAGTGGGPAVTSASSGAPQTSVTSSGLSTGATGPGGHGGEGGGEGGGASTGETASTGTGGGSTGGGGEGGGPSPVDECTEQLDDCLAGERCVDLEVGFDCSALRILILEESAASGVVGDGLVALGADVVEGPAFTAWDGTNPPLGDIDAVVWFQAIEYLTQMSADAQTVLANYVAAGGGLVRTEWGAYMSPFFTGPADRILPVTFLGTNATGTSWSRAISDHPIGAGLPATFPDATMRYSLVTALPGATVVWENPSLTPLVVTSDAFGGRVVYVNHDVTYLGNTIGPEATRIFVDAAIYAAR